MKLVDAPVEGGSWLEITVASLRDFSHLRYSPERQVWKIPESSLEILVKQLLSREASPDHHFTELPRRDTDRSENGCMAYDLT